jgi:hypothetical protein
MNWVKTGPMAIFTASLARSQANNGAKRNISIWIITYGSLGFSLTVEDGFTDMER